MNRIAEDGPGKKEVMEMFNAISSRYDFLDHFMSFGIDHYWRRKALDYLKVDKPAFILDIATGTADFAIKALRILKAEKVIGVDIAHKMLDIGRSKIKAKKLDDRIHLQSGDAENLDFPDNHFDALTIAFGVRNFVNLELGLSEMRRVLKENARFVILEFSLPGKFPVKQFYRFYFNGIVPLLGRWFARHQIAYEYLPGSVNSFPYGEKFVHILKNAGFRNIVYKTLTFGICTVYSGLK